MSIVSSVVQRRESPRQPCFWNETIRLPGLFEQLRQANDYANATAAFGGLARLRFQEVERRPEYDPTKKSIVSSFQPKSGGTFLHNRLLQLGYQEFWWGYPSRRSHAVNFVSDEAMQYYLRGGCACHSHALPDPNILAAFDRTGVEKIWVHLRNPAESAVSSFYHYMGEGHGRGEIGATRKQQALHEAPRQGLTAQSTVSDFAVGAIKFLVDWVADWLRFAQDHPGLVVFSFYDELSDLQAMLSRVFAELGVAWLGEAPTALTDHDRYRHKRTTNWRTELTPTAQKYIELRMRTELQGFAAFERLWGG